MPALRYNDLRTTLGSSLTNSGTTITFSAPLTHSNGTAVPTISGNWIFLALLDATTGALLEIVRLTAYTAGATTGTITRGQEGTTGIAHSAGELVANVPLAGDFDSPWSGFSYAANWADIGLGWQTARYRKVDSYRVRLELYAVRSSSSSGVNATIGTLPSGFRPASIQLVGELWSNGGVLTANQVYVTSAGLVVTGASITVGNSVPVFAEFTLD